MSRGRLESRGYADAGEAVAGIEPLREGCTLVEIRVDKTRRHRRTLRICVRTRLKGGSRVRWFKCLVSDGTISGSRYFCA